MKIKMYKLSELDKNLKATVHKTGKLGFTRDAAIKLNLQEKKSAYIGYNEEDPTDNSLYVSLSPEDKGDFKIIKSGAYYYINTKVLFDNLKKDYSKKNIVYDITEEEIDGTRYYKLKARQQPTKSASNNESDPTKQQA
ncbi:hypothetical protein [Chitinophaga caseinilytica]|uniref:hypothetical protein n=1 Tax=Chitinophaga caseinilytica TaxID=2267521 RepID=UPI003C2FB368